MDSGTQERKVEVFVRDATMKRILIVEDEPLIAELVSTVLSDAGYEIIGIAADETSAVRQASRVVPEFVVMDIKLANNSDGVEVARRLQCGRSIPILFTSAYLDHHTMKRAAATNPAGFLRKPYSPEALLLAVAAVEQAAVKTRQPRQNLLN
jgi:two-component system, response regulator PdtaR